MNDADFAALVATLRNGDATALCMEDAADELERHRSALGSAAPALEVALAVFTDTDRAAEDIRGALVMARKALEDTPKALED